MCGLECDDYAPLSSEYDEEYYEQTLRDFSEAYAEIIAEFGEGVDSE